MRAFVPSVIPCESGVCGEAVRITGQAVASRAVHCHPHPRHGSPCSDPSAPPARAQGPPSPEPVLCLCLISSTGWKCLSVFFGATFPSSAQTRCLSELGRSRLDE